jgi:hypothetical protein
LQALQMTLRFGVGALIDEGLHAVAQQKLFVSMQTHT